MQTVIDLRDPLFQSLHNQTFTAEVIATGCGVLAGGRHAATLLQESGCELLRLENDGRLLQPGDVVLSFCGSAKQVAVAEDRVLGAMMVPSGYATRARRLQVLAGERLRVVCGGWKKIPQAFKPGLHAALAAAGVGMRMVDEPFVYVDKNYVRMFGGVGPALAAAAQFPDRVKVIQLRGEMCSLADEAREAVTGGADVVMVDTGRLADIAIVQDVLETLGVRDRIRVAFAGGVTEDTLLTLRHLPVDLVDVGAAILDAPMLDMRVDVVVSNKGQPGRD
ncbi:MAG: hypothetical protein K6T63_14880 [Alicyclobacillus herbarius]|uniref:hypothetical protein n=1 Tax=Alicyclobacillus herbarius TaxID=122960 RepID=UPI0023542DD9|nr:hypothetical protein [Alicyclobacillus herbarius]MCL6633900.1 hypothetical protein [Alicyclobacillus herbarius]